MYVKLKHVKRVTSRAADGSTRVYYYHRRTGKRIHGEPGTAEFQSAYADAGKIDRPEPPADTLGGLIARFKASSSFFDLALTTRIEYDRNLQAIEKSFGHDMPLQAFDDRRIRDDILTERDRIARTAKRAADYRISVLKRVLSFAVEAGLIVENHAAQIGKVYKANRSDCVWSDAEIAAFRSAASAELQLALIVGLHTGQRQGDLLKLTWSAYDGQAISLVQSKTKRRVFIPCTAELKGALDDAPRRAVTILTSSRGQPWTSSGFRSSWGDATQLAGIKDRHFHDLRGTTVTLLAEAGCSVPEIASITGHSLSEASRIVDLYLSRSQALSRGAIVKFENARRTKK